MSSFMLIRDEILGLIQRKHFTRIAILTVKFGSLACHLKYCDCGILEKQSSETPEDPISPADEATTQ